MIKPEPQRLDIEDRLISRARRKNAGDGSETVVEIFDPGRPSRCDRKLGAEANRRAHSREQDHVLIAGDTGTIDTKRACDQANPPVPIDQPMIEGVAEATAQRRDIVDLVGDDGALGRSSGKDRTVLEEIRERNIAFDSEEQPGRQNVIVACLQAAIETAERIA